MWSANSQNRRVIWKILADFLKDKFHVGGGLTEMLAATQSRHDILQKKKKKKKKKKNVFQYFCLLVLNITWLKKIKSFTLKTSSSRAKSSRKRG